MLLPVFGLALGAAFSAADLVRADLIHTKSGQKIEAEILEDLGQSYRIRTRIGVVDIEKEQVVKIEKSPSPWQRYEKKRKACPDTAEGHYKLAKWCEDEHLAEEERTHLKAAIKLNPNHAAARKALGYVKKDGKWVKEPSSRAPTQEELDERRQSRRSDELARKLVSEWFVKVDAIHRGRMVGRDARSKVFREARSQVLSIDNPLAITALGEVLSTGNEAARQVMVEALGRFAEDQATMNLLAVTVLDPSKEVRELAVLELAKRKDDRIVQRLREALASEEEFILRNAATALGILRARAAVEDLVPLLSMERKAPVVITRGVWLNNLYIGFPRPTCWWCFGRRVFFVADSIDVLRSQLSLIGTVSSYEVQWVNVYRTEVQEALITITGQNFGFDQKAWLAWWRAQQKQSG